MTVDETLERAKDICGGGSGAKEKSLLYTVTLLNIKRRGDGEAGGMGGGSSFCP